MALLSHSFSTFCKGLIVCFYLKSNNNHFLLNINLDRITQSDIFFREISF